MEELKEEIRLAINRSSRENASNTPDYILAQFLVDALASYEKAVNKRDWWYGEDRNEVPLFVGANNEQ